MSTAVADFDRPLPELVGAMQGGSINPAELLDDTLQAIAADVTGSFVHPDRVTIEPSSNPDGLLGNVPLAVKALVHAEVCEGGLPLFEGDDGIDNDPYGNGFPLVPLFKEAGAIVVGFTLSPEAGAREAGWNEAHGHTSNAYSSEHNSGGSSSGSGTATALGIVPLATGSDYGGSLRIPAAWNGLYGFAPGSWINEALRLDNHDSMFGRARDGIIARDALSTAYAYQVLRELTNFASGETSFVDAYYSDKPVRIGYTLDPMFSTYGYSHDAQIAQDNAIRQLRRHGHDLVEIKDLGVRDFTRSAHAYLTIGGFAFQQYLDEITGRLAADGQLKPESLEDLIYAAYISGRGTSRKRVERAVASLERDREHHLDALADQDIDVVMTPTTRGLPPLNGEVVDLDADKRLADLARMMDHLGPVGRYTVSQVATRVGPSNDLLGQMPALPAVNAFRLAGFTAPMGTAMSDQGTQPVELPMGSHFYGQSDETLMTLMGQLERRKTVPTSPNPEI